MNVSKTFHISLIGICIVLLKKYVSATNHDLPRVTIKPNFNPYIITNETTFEILACEAVTDISVALNYTWYHNGSVIGSASSYTIQNVTLNTNGNYSCVVISENGVGSDWTQIIVHYGPTVNSLQSQIIKEGDRLSVTCSATANPSASIFYWTKNGDSSFRQDNSQLVLNNIRRSQSGTYTCYAQNTLTPSRGNHMKQSDKASISVDVRYVPDIVLDPSTDPYIAYEGQSSISIRCNGTNANPGKVDYTWSKDTSVVASTSELQTSSVDRSDEGTYTCVATNSAGSNSKSVKLEVQYAPEIIITSSTSGFHVVEGKTLTLTCLSDAKPNVSAYWWILKDGTQKNSISLTINRITRSQSGIYTCHAKNTLTPTGIRPITKETTKHWNVIVQYGPDSTIALSPSFKNKTLHEGEQLDSVQCTAACNPTCSFRWQTPTRTISSNVLPAQNISKSEAGIYRCNAWNIVSAAAASFAIDVLYKPTITSGSFTRNSITEETETVLKCNIDSKPDSNITIEFNNSQIHHKYLTSFSEYKITSTNCLNTGNYLCKAKNSLGEAMRYIYFNVLCAPRLDKRYQASSMIFVRPNTTSNILEATFLIVANPKPDMKLAFRDTSGSFIPIPLSDLTDGTDIAGDFVAPRYKATLVKHNFTATDEGEYVITVTNKIGESIFKISTAEIKSSEDQQSLVWPIAGGTAAFVVVLVVVIIILWKRRLHLCNNKRSCKCLSGIKCRKKQTQEQTPSREEDIYVNQAFGDQLTEIHNNNKNRQAALNRTNEAAFKFSDVENKDFPEQSQPFTNLEFRSDSHQYTSQDRLQETSLNEAEKGDARVNLPQADPELYQNLKSNDKKKTKALIYENIEITSKVLKGGLVTKSSPSPGKGQSTANTSRGVNIGTENPLGRFNKEISMTTASGNSYRSNKLVKGNLVRNELANPKTNVPAMNPNVFRERMNNLKTLLDKNK